MNHNLSDIFNIDNFNIYSDSENYYFFRALEELDIEGIKNKNIVDENGKIIKLITDREFYGATSGYTENSEISLEEVVRHIKMHYDRHTNCISLTSNANTAITYGRQTYDDKYVMIKVPKSEINKSVYPAGLYMLKEIDKKIDELIANHDLEDYDMQKYFMDAIDNCKTEEQLELIRSMLPKKDNIDDRDIYENGLEFDITDSRNYQALSKKQNFEKDKIILKLDVLNKRLIPRISNKFLTQVVGLGFSSLEVVHYKDISQDRIIELSSEITDLFGLLQQMPDMQYIDELKSLILTKYNTYQNDKQFAYKDSIVSNELTIDNMYDITEGKVDYKTARTLYKKAFSLAKSKLRIRNSIELLKEIVNDSKYDEILSYMEQNGYGIEPEITTRASENLFKVSESVSIDINESEKDLVDFINSLDSNSLVNILNNPNETLKLLLNKFVNKNYLYSGEKEDWFANSIIDNLDFESLGVHENLSELQRKDIIIALKENNFLDLYYELKNQGVKEADISRVLFTNLIKNKDTVDLEDNFNLEEFEWFIGYNRVKGLGLNLRNYQRTAVKNVKNKFSDKQFTSVILPTGAGKSYVALEQLYEYRNEKMIYIAPNVEILNQLRGIIRKTYQPEEHLGEDIDVVISRLFPNLTLTTYQNLTNKETKTLKEEFKTNYSLIVFDELHRTGATEWMNQINELLNNQDANTKILGITATPERDMDLKNMADYWAQRYGYSDEEILKGKHLAYNMDIVDAIKLGIIANPKVINCTYSLISDGSMDNLKTSIEDIVDENIKAQKLADYKELRQNIENSNGIEQILHDNIKENSKYIIFLPVTQKNQGVYEDLDGNEIDKSTAEEIIDKYQLLMRQYLFSYDYLNSENNKVKELYLKIKENNNLTAEEKSYLEQEKKKILLLTKIDIPGKSNALNTDTNLIADTIINYMNWESIEYKNQLYWLKNLTNEKIEDYSMLGSYSDRKNKKQLDSFNDAKNHKTKFMFVMNKLNEGVHVDDITGIVWLRPLDTNSRILYLQQLGRCIKSLTPGKEITEDDIPLVIDLVNNTLKVKLDKGMSPFERDLQKLKYIEEWIETNDRYPVFGNEEETTYLNTLIDIKSKYEKYLDSDLLKDQDVKNRLLIEEIIEVSSNIDLWSQELPTRQYDKKTKGTSNGFDLLFEINMLSRDFIELSNEVEELDSLNKNVLYWIKNIQEYCKTYEEWPKYSKKDKCTKDGTTSAQLANWLSHSGYNKGEFKYTDIVDENGRPIKEILDELYNKYGQPIQGSRKSILQWVRRIQEYCEIYKEWPKQPEKNKCTKDGTTSAQLASWLETTSGYKKVEFKYSDIVDETGRPIKEILDELYNKYGKPTRGSVESILQWVKNIQEYCKTYEEWPKNEKKDKCTKHGITSAQLANWLSSSGYNKGQFRYSDVVDENGKPIKEILDELNKKYGTIIPGSIESILQWVKNIQEYCKTYEEWPKNEKKDKCTKDGITSDQLSKWLFNSGYKKGEFKYSDIVNETGRPIKEILDELYNKYGQPTRGSVESILQWVKNIQEYCKTYEEWPKQPEKNKCTKDGTTSVQLAIWLSHSGYNKGEFKYSDIVDETGRPIKEILDELYNKYGQPTRGSVESILQWVKNIQEYCKTYEEWPKQPEKNKCTKDGITSVQLANWLSSSGYNKGQFRYSDVVDENGKPIKEILDELNKKYGTIIPGSIESILQWVKNIQEYCEIYEEWPNLSKKSKNNVLKDGTTSSQLVSWLRKTSGYNKEQFKYPDVVDENGKPIKEILDELYYKYKLKKQEEFEKAKEAFSQTSKFNEVVEMRNKNDRRIS